MFWDWLHRIIYWRDIREQASEMDAMMTNWDRQEAELNARIRANFTEAEWNEVAARCEKKLAEFGY